MQRGEPSSAKKLCHRSGAPNAKQEHLCLCADANIQLPFRRCKQSPMSPCRAMSERTSSRAGRRDGAGCDATGTKYAPLLVAGLDTSAKSPCKGVPASTAPCASQERRHASWSTKRKAPRSVFSPGPAACKPWREFRSPCSCAMVAPHIYAKRSEALRLFVRNLGREDKRANVAERLLGALGGLAFALRRRDPDVRPSHLELRREVCLHIALLQRNCAKAPIFVL